MASKNPEGLPTGIVDASPALRGTSGK